MLLSFCGAFQRGLGISLGKEDLHLGCTLGGPHIQNRVSGYIKRIDGLEGDSTVVAVSLNEGPHSSVES